MAEKVYSFEEVSKHNKNGDCWLILFGKVYDVSTFMSEHPGGDDILVQSTGQDATDHFEDVGHSDSARELMNKFCIGKIELSTLPSKNKGSTASAAATNKNSGDSSKILLLVLPLLMLGLAFVLRQYSQKE